MEGHIYSVKAKSQASNIWVKDIMTQGVSQKIKTDDIFSKLKN